MFTYLIVNHVPFGKTNKPNTFKVGSMWLEDLHATQQAMQEFGIQLMLATPLVENLEEEQSGSFDLVEINPQEEGFEYYPLPGYFTPKEFLKIYFRLRKILTQVITHADIIQADYGGYPIALGQVVWPLLKNKPKIWVFDGGDPFSLQARNIQNQRSFLKKSLQFFLMRQFEVFCQRAIAQADLVFSHNEAVVRRFQKVWDERHCYLFPRTFVHIDTIITEQDWQKRQKNILENNILRLVIASRQILIKGTDQVIKAIKTVRDQGIAVELDVLGEGEDLPYFKKLTQQLELAQFIRFHGQVPYGASLFDYWAKADVMVITNLTSEISRNVFLAMARGLPLVIYRNPGTDNLIESNQAGILVAANDIDGLANAFHQLAHHREQLIELGNNGLQLVKQHTLENCHRKRAELALSLLKTSSVSSF